MGRELVDPRRSALESAMPRVPADDAVAGITTALFVAVAGAAPWAFGVLIYQHPQGWQSAAGRYALLLAEAIVVVTAIVVVVGVVRSRVQRRRVPADGGARAVRHRSLAGDVSRAAGHLADDDLGPRAGALLRRAQNAVRAVTFAQICRDGLLDAGHQRGAGCAAVGDSGCPARAGQAPRAAILAGGAEPRLAGGRTPRAAPAGRAGGGGVHRRPGGGARALRGRGPPG